MSNALRAYQKEGVKRLIEITQNRGAALLADEPGLGKTIQVIEFINQLALDTILIVCPASLRTNWNNELTEWLVNTLQHIEIVSYEAVVSGKPRLDSYDLIVFDEAHYLKNSAAKRTKACLKLNAKRRLFLTGTPIVNRPMDAFPILQSCGMKLNKTEYGKRYCAGKLIPIRWKPVKKYAWDFSGASNTEELGRSLRRNIMVRRTKREVLSELPSKIRQVIELDIELPESEALTVAVDRMFKGFTEAAENIKGLKSIAFTELSKARLSVAQSKLAHTVSFAEDILEEEEKLVIFAYHREIVDAISDHFADRAVKLYGGMTDTQKNEAVDRFQNGDAKVFVGQIAAAGTGLTLTAAHTMLFAELDWVPGNVIQCEDRCHRFGQTEPVRIFHITAAGSVDARMVKALVDKQKVIETVTS
jgi:SWI/SNF-related matrix-associated actin-dependent regulator 1 of chromatin subfamily A